MTESKKEREENDFHGLVNLDSVPVKVKTDVGLQESELNGQILFYIYRSLDGLKLQLKELNLTASSVECKEGKSGLLSLGLKRGSEKLLFFKDNRFEIEFLMAVHYPLITRVRGYQKSEKREQDYFVPYTLKAKGVLKGSLESPLESIFTRSEQKRGSKEIKLKAELSIQTDENFVNNLFTELREYIIVIVVTFQRQINVQPVFVRSDPNDSSPTGWSFDTLMQVAKCNWRKCCVHFNVLDPIYVDDASYKELSSLNEWVALKNEVSVDNAIEVFMADHMTNQLYDDYGGGGCFDSGQADAKIVSCDEQLKVFDPTTGASLGAVNYNHLAHELGHAMGLVHPGEIANPPMVEATANTLMEPSGFVADNPHQQSQHNCDSLNNPLFYWRLIISDYRCVQNPEIP